jgi:hypothetical protein
MRASIWSLIRNLFESKIQLRRCIRGRAIPRLANLQGGIVAKCATARRVPLLNRRYLSK